jgi:hypothetical protein
MRRLDADADGDELDADGESDAALTNREGVVEYAAT